MAKLARDNFETSAYALINRSDKDLNKVMENEEVINYLNHHITSYLVKLNALDITDSDSDYIARVFHAINDIERVGDHATNLAEAAERNRRRAHVLRCGKGRVESALRQRHKSARQVYRGL